MSSYVVEHPAKSFSLSFQWSTDGHRSATVLLIGLCYSHYWGKKWGEQSIYSSRWLVTVFRLLLNRSGIFDLLLKKYCSFFPVSHLLNDNASACLLDRNCHKQQPKASAGLSPAVNKIVSESQKHTDWISSGCDRKRKEG